jgi:signal transduction histidine kinase/ketosteroid isomerase-like protein
MKLTKKLQAEILRLYHSCWDANLRGDIKTFASYLDDDVTLFGTAAGEAFNSKKEAFKFYKATADQMTGKADFRKRRISIRGAGNSVAMKEECDLYVLAEEKWIFYGHARITAVFEQKEKTWKIVQWHASFPDSRTEEGQQVNTDKIKAENVQLREAVRRRTEDLENKNRELEIETALEKVRAVAMGIKQPADMLEICKTISLQLQLLGVSEIRNVQTAIFYEKKGTYMNYEYYAKHNKTFITETIYTNHKIAKDFAAKMMKGKGQFYVTHIKGKKVKDWVAYQKTTNVFIDKYLNKASSLNYYWHSLGPVALGISTYYPLSKGELELFQRFLKVFELAYRRYLDIEKAIAQAREAQIEAALERVRAKTMGMHHSNELHDVIETVTNQLIILGLKFDAASFNTINDDDSWESWISTPEQAYPSLIHVPYLNHKIFNQTREQKAKGAEFFTDIFDKEETRKFYKHFFENTIARNAAEERKKYVLSRKGIARSVFLIKDIWLSISLYEPTPFSDEDNFIIKRFAKVFEQSYTRFLDLQKAEAQAREAQIELSLERVRAMTMAMRTTNDLSAIIGKIYQELTSLDVVLDRCFIMVFEEARQGVTWWTASRENLALQHGYFVKHHEHEPYLAYYKAWRDRKEKWTYVLGGDTKKKWDKFLFSQTELKDLPEVVKAGMKAVKTAFIAGSFSSFGCLTTGTYQPLLENQMDLLVRFTKVFDQTYTRFLDLQKAEAQAREAQIQLALERVRARTMAMHHSDELTEVVKLLYQEFDKLKISNESTDIEIGLINEETGVASVWAHFYLSDGSISTFKLPLTYFDETRHEFNVWKATPVEKRNELFFTTVFAGDRLNQFSKFDTDLPELAEIFRPLVEAKIEKWVTHNAHFSHGFLTLQGTEAYSPETQEIQKRFAKVFEQTYIRFLDLQKAEAQAREAQIEAALERVRSRTMAMHRSDELADVAALLFRQVESLGIKTWTTGFNVWSDDNNFYTDYITSPQGVVIEPYTIDSSVYEVFKKVSDAKKRGDDFYMNYEEGETLKETYRQLSGFNNKAQYDKMLEDGFQFPPHQYEHFVFGAKVSLMFITYEPVPEAHDIFKRFGKVFEQTYTRFLDLQKAEAQARESQIQLSLERARAQSMMMQHSKELDDTLRVFHEQVLLLGIPSAFSFLWLPDEEIDRHIFWAAWAENNATKSKAINYPLDRNEPATAQCFVDWKSDVPVHSYNIPPVGVENYFAAWSELFAGAEQLQPKYFKQGLYYVEAFMKYGCFGVMVKNELTDDEKKILFRFSIEFERAYTRFLDLQKAEAQAWEAQIEMALEKVRSRSMAMHKSAELKEVIRVVLEQFVHLNVNVGHAGFYIDYKDHDDMHIWLADPNIEPFFAVIPYFDAPTWNSFLEAKANGTVLHTDLLDFEEKNKFYQSLFKLFTIPEEAKEFYMQCRGLAVSTVLLDNVGLYIENFDAEPYTDDENKILMRFAKVFEQTYTRFLDLQRAEAQAREAQIEAALERVRSRTLAMQKSDELAETAAVLFQQLIQLGIAPNRLYITLTKDDEGNAEFWITDEDGSKVGLAYEANLNENPTFRKMFEGWKQQKESLIIDMQGQELQEYFRYLRSINVPFKGGPEQKRRVQHLAYFSKGFIGMASPEEQPAETMQLLQRFAYVFNLTYTRFNDLQQAEAHALQAEQDFIAIKEAKQKAEEALTELQATQKQLIQSEKMASLGELTAGIAHEIQNPLNFVNNFSEVSNELVAEMNEELHKGNMAEAKAIAADILQNLEKINHHGKRADAIVKGMLQHSRTSSGQKVPTDINSLADEYVRLAYHGLRAKDKSFNAKFDTRLDSSIAMINIVPQDIGRVILNLINNAFYAVSEKKKRNENGYEPVVTISTTRSGDAVEIRISDNGTGISQKNLSKIFQPFFTTKPTGQGTGLGLSLAYDIVKAHGGELKVETKEDEGSSFIINLPVNN